MPTTLGKYQLGKTLGSGVSCKVKLAKDATGTRFAVKILHNDDCFVELIKTEVECLMNLKHPGIVNLVEQGTGVMTNSKKAPKTVDYIVLELVQGGELFDFVANSGRFTEEVARFYFHQFMEALNYMHTSGSAHRDLKPENIMLDADFNLKIADFGFAAPTEGRDGKGFLQTQLGTASYMAPEIHLGKPYTGQGVDLFASAIILFVMLSQRPPFGSPNPTDPHYRLLAADRSDLFWKAHDEADGGTSIYSAEFKDLFNKMTRLNPSQRLTMEQLLAHPWMKGPKSSKNEVRAEFMARKKAVDLEISNEKDEKRASRAENKRGIKRGHGDFSQMEEDKIESEGWVEIEMEDYEPTLQKHTQFFSTGHRLDFWNVLRNFVRELKPVSMALDLTVKAQDKEEVKKEVLKEDVEPPRVDEWTWKNWNAREGKFKASYELPSSDVKVVVELLRVDDGMMCVEVSRMAGDQRAFLQHYRAMLDCKEMGYFNDASLNI